LPGFTGFIGIIREQEIIRANPKNQCPIFIMPYLVDGHNLIPKVPGLNLEAMDDEIQLIEMLQEFCRVRRKQVEVVFDNAPAGQPRARNYGTVIARFARAGQTADALIQAQLQRLGRAARNWTVVSSDHQVQAAARAARAPYLSSEVFAGLLEEALQGSGTRDLHRSEAGLPPEEVDEWLRLFHEKKDGEQGEY